jgi:hypothetical protein
MLISGIFASEALDSSGETLRVKGADISSLNDGTGYCNYEHNSSDKNGTELVGRVLSAKKIYSSDDCSNAVEKHFWEDVRLPFIFGTVRLFTEGDHDGALALAAIIRDCVLHGETMFLGFSIEGSTLKKDGNELLRTVCRGVALTQKSCNKTAKLLMISDPTGKAKSEFGGPDIASLVDNKKSEGSIDPMHRRLGGHEASYGAEILKAMTAGNMNAAPSTLTGGAALQRTDLHQKAMGAYKDWNASKPKKTKPEEIEVVKSEFKSFLKNQLPEVSDEFLDHFSDLVSRHSFRVAKAEQVIATLAKAGKKPAKPKAAPAEAAPDLTIQGKPVPRPPEGTRSVSFDPQKGTLTTRQGVFQASTPSAPHPHLLEHTGKAPQEIAQHFGAEMAAQRVHHQRAMKNWFNVNDQFTKGTLSPGVVAHAVAFGLMSPGTPVPQQEHLFGHFVDALHSQGVQVPGLDTWNATYKDLMARNRTGLPQHSQEHFKNLESELKNKAGQFIGFNKPDKFSEYFGGYLADHHNQVIQAIKDAKGDASVVARRLTEVRGMGPKLARYITSMMGGGSLTVPDTHFIRHYFGGRPDAPGQRPGTSPDSAAIEHLKNSILSSAGSHDVLEGVDKHYFENHDAVKSVLNDPTIGPYFKGRERQAIFPAFWHHWISIPGHEARIGTPNKYASNEGMDHAPFWDAVRPLLNKSEDAEYDPDMPFRTAMQHHRWVENYGPVHALGLYYRYLVPQLQENDAKRDTFVMRKFDELQVEMFAALRKAKETQTEAPEYVYHITHHNRLTGIASRGLVPNSPRSIGAPGYDFHAKGRTFLTSPEGVNFWHERSEAFAEHNHDHPADDGAVPVVLRTPKPADLKADELGTKDAYAPAYVTSTSIHPKNLEVFNGKTWTPIAHHRTIEPRDAFDFEQDPEGGSELQYFKPTSPFLPSLEKAELRKAQDKITSTGKKLKPPPIQDTDVVDWQGGKVRAGKGILNDHQHMYLLGGDAKYFMGVPKEKFPHFTPEDVVKMPRGNTNLMVHVAPERLDAPSTITAKEHGVGEYLQHPESQALAEGFDFEANTSSATKGSRKGFSFWGQHPNGQKVYVKGEPGWVRHPWNLPEARQEGVYSNLARSFFGMGQYVPPVAVVRHPKTGIEHAIVAHAPGEERSYANPEHQKVMKSLGDSGELDKAAFMNLVMGNTDRNPENYLVDTKANTMHLIDHNLILREDPQLGPAYMGYGAVDKKAPVHPEAIKWAQQLNPDELEAQLRRHEIPEPSIHGATERLRSLQKLLTKNPTVARSLALTLPQQSENERHRW